MAKYDYKPFDFRRPAELDGQQGQTPVAIIGAGPIGLAMAIDLAQRGIKTVVLDDNNVVSVGSRAICWSKRTLEILDRLGVGERMLDKGVTWKIGRQFQGNSEIYAFDLLPEDGHKYPAFINLQQYYVEEYLVERCQELARFIDLRFLNKVTDHKDLGDQVVLSVETPEGAYELRADYLIACDGAGSSTRQRMGLSFEGQTFQEQFLIVDIEMDQSPFPDATTPERWFWFDPSFHPGKSALLHMQPDNLYRIDLQLDVDADAQIEAREENVMPRIKAIVGDKPFRLDWVSVYKFRCIKLDRFVHNRVLFVGDSAHVVSPFGARGGNGGIQDVDNLGWKLAAVLHKEAPSALLESYHDERSHGSAENILNSSRSTNFMTPKTKTEALFRAEALRLAKHYPFAQKLLNSGRLSLPCSLQGMPLMGAGEGLLPVGSPVLDAPVEDGWLLERLGNGFTLFTAGDLSLPQIEGIDLLALPKSKILAERYGVDRAYLFRPDGHVCAIFSAPTTDDVTRARDHALAKGTQQ